MKINNQNKISFKALPVASYKLNCLKNKAAKFKLAVVYRLEEKDINFLSNLNSRIWGLEDSCFNNKMNINPVDWKIVIVNTLNEAISKLASKQNSLLYLIAVDKKPVGIISGEQNFLSFKKTAQIDQLAKIPMSGVDKLCYIGKTLLYEFLNNLQEIKVVEVGSLKLTNSTGFYKKCGFEKAGSNKYLDLMKITQEKYQVFCKKFLKDHKRTELNSNSVDLADILGLN